MAVLTVVSVLLLPVLVQSEPAIKNYRNEASQFGDLLRPPPPPPLPIIPVPFHGGPVRSHQSIDSYQYQVPPPPKPPVLLTASSDFKYPAPFYRPYNFDFVPQPHPFTTTPSPSMFQKVSQWLFPSQQTTNDFNSASAYTVPPLKKDCNPCNFSPWIPVIRYDLSKNNQENVKPIYGPPHSTASSNLYNTIQNVPQRFNKQEIKANPQVSYNSNSAQYNSGDNFYSVSSTYGPPSPTHTVTISHNTHINTNGLSSISPLITSEYKVTSNTYNPSSYLFPNPPSTPLSPSSSFYITQTTPHTPTFTDYNPQSLNNQLSNDNKGFSSTTNPSNELELPKVEQPTQFKNSYGEPILNTYALDIPYAPSAIGAESHKIKTEVLPDSKPVYPEPNVSISIANPAPFSLNKGRNIHTLQPVALPNLSVSPLPPIFNARPFRPVLPKYNIHKNINHINEHLNNVNIAKSIPIAEFVHSIEYPTTVIQSPIIDIDASKTVNQTKAYRNIPNSYVIDDVRDISPQASEDHIAAANNHPDASFESTGLDYANDLYDSGLPSQLKYKVPSNHKPTFADLRGLKDEDIDKYRTDTNLQHIDSPLLYLKPSAPHKNFANFFTPSTPRNLNEYEIYDEIVTTEAPQESTLTSAWDESRTYFAQDLSPPKKKENINRAKVVQIIVPYTKNDKEDSNPYEVKDWPFNLEKEFQARKVQSQTETTYFNTSTDIYENTVSTTTEQSTSSSGIMEDYNSDNLQPQSNDVYDVKEQPFDIIKLQHTIDAWTQQEYSNEYKMQDRTRSNEKYAKQIPDDYFTTISPIVNTFTENYNYNYDVYDHEGASSIQYTVKHNLTNHDIKPKPFMHYNSIERSKVDHESGKNEDNRDNSKLHIYTAASKFRKPTTTPPPWGQIQTSISPLTKEKVYVVTSKPWREKLSSSKENSKESGRALDEGDDLPFKSPRFSNRPSIENQTDVFTNGWFQTINNLESRMFTESSSVEDISKEDEKEEEESPDESRS